MTAGWRELRMACQNTLHLWTADALLLKAAAQCLTQPHAADLSCTRGHEVMVRYINKISETALGGKQHWPCVGARRGRPISQHLHGSASLAPYDGWADDVTCAGKPSGIPSLQTQLVLPAAIPETSFCGQQAGTLVLHLITKAITAWQCARQHICACLGVVLTSPLSPSLPCAPPAPPSLLQESPRIMCE